MSNDVVRLLMSDPNAPVLSILTNPHLYTAVEEGSNQFLAWLNSVLPIVLDIALTGQQGGMQQDTMVSGNATTVLVNMNDRTEFTTKMVENPIFWQKMDKFMASPFADDLRLAGHFSRLAELALVKVESSNMHATQLLYHSVKHAHQSGYHSLFMKIMTDFHDAFSVREFIALVVQDEMKGNTDSESVQTTVRSYVSAISPGDVVAIFRFMAQRIKDDDVSVGYIQLMRRFVVDRGEYNALMDERILRGLLEGIAGVMRWSSYTSRMSWTLARGITDLAKDEGWLPGVLNATVNRFYLGEENLIGGLKIFKKCWMFTAVDMIFSKNGVHSSLGAGVLEAIDDMTDDELSKLVVDCRIIEKLVLSSHSFFTQPSYTLGTGNSFVVELALRLMKRGIAFKKSDILTPEYDDLLATGALPYAKFVDDSSKNAQRIGYDDITA